MHPDPKAYARRWKTLAVLSLSLLIIGLDNTVLNVALPTLQTEFSASGSTLQWIVDAYLLSFAGVLLTMGTLGDRFGRKRALQWGLGIFGGASVLAAFAQNADQLIVLRAVMGIGGAMIMPATLSVIMDVFPREERGKAIGIWSAIAGVGIGLGPFVGGLLLEWFSWSSVFWLNVPIVAIALVAGRFLVPESRDPRPGAFDLTGAGLSIATLVSLVYAIIEAGPRGWTDPLVLGCFALAAVLGVAFVVWERRVPAPMLPLDFFRNPSFSVASVSVGLVFFAMMGSVFAFTQYLQFARGFSALEAGAAMIPLAFGLVVGSGLSNRLTQRVGRARVIAGGLFGVAAVLSTSLAVDAGDGAGSARVRDVRPRAVDGLRDGAGDGIGHERRARGQGRCRIGDERRHAAGRRCARRRRHRFDHRHRVLERHERVAGGRRRVRRRRPRGRRCRSAARPVSSSPTPPGRRSREALGIGLTAAAVVALAGAVLVLLRLPSGRGRPGAGSARAAGRRVEVRGARRGLRRAPLRLRARGGQRERQRLAVRPGAQRLVGADALRERELHRLVGGRPGPRLDGRRQRVPAHQQRRRSARTCR